MEELSEARKALIDYFKDNNFDKEEMLAVCLLCRTEENVKEMLEFCQTQTISDFTELLKKAVEIYQQDN